MLRSIYLLVPVITAASSIDLEAGHGAFGSCGSRTPSFIGAINSAVPEINFNQIGQANVTTVYKDAISVPGETIYIDTIIEFQLPDPAYGCQLEVDFDVGYDEIHGYSGYCQKFDVWNLPSTVPYDEDGYVLSWSNAPEGTDIFGTIDGLGIPEDNTLFTGYTTKMCKVVNSQLCKSKMTYRVRVPEETGQGGLEFLQQDSPFGGWVVKYNC